MPGKEASVFNIFNSVSVSGSASVSAATFTSSVTANLYRDNIGYQINFSGNPVGIFQFNGSNDYNPKLPQSGDFQGSSPNGTWFTFASVSTANVFSPYGLNINQFPFAFIQFQFVSATSSGLLSGYISSKSLGS